MEKADIIYRAKLFENLLPEEIDMLSGLSHRKKYEPGEIVFNEGDIGDALYVIENGEVDIIRKGKDGREHVLARVKEPEFFGEMSLIDKEYRSATVKAVTSAEMLVLTSENLRSFARVYRNGFTLLTINIARALSFRLREANRKLIEYGIAPTTSFKT